MKLRLLYKTFIYCLLVPFASILAQEGSTIKLQIENYNNRPVYLAEFFAGSSYIIDTAYTDSKGLALFYHQENLPGGIYYLVFPNKLSLEIMLGENQDVLLRTNILNIYDRSAIENKGISHEWHQLQKHIRQQENQLQQVLLQQPKNKEGLKAQLKEAMAIDRALSAHIVSAMEKNKDNYLGHYLHTMYGKPTKTSNLYQKLFSHIHFNAHLLRNPHYFALIDTFVNGATSISPENFIPQVDSLIAQVRQAGDTNLLNHTLVWLHKSAVDKSLDFLKEYLMDYYNKHLQNSACKIELGKTFPAACLDNGNSKPNINNKIILLLQNHCPACNSLINEIVQTASIHKSLIIISMDGNPIEKLPVGIDSLFGSGLTFGQNPDIFSLPACVITDYSGIIIKAQAIKSLKEMGY